MKHTLNERNIDTVCTEASAFLVRRKTNSKDLRKYRTMRAAVWRVTISHPQPANSLTYRQ